MGEISMIGKVYHQKLTLNDPLFFHKSSANDSVNYLHDRAREDKDRFYSKFYFAISLALTIFASFFISLISILILINILIILLIISTERYKKSRKIFWTNREKMKESFKVLGMEWRD
jgi:hypothetical protein